MNESQIFSLAITVTAILAGSIFNNLRISDLASAMNGRFDDVSKRMDGQRDLLRAEIRAENAELRTEIRAENAELRADLREQRALLEKNQDTVMRILADMDHRVTRLEERGR